MPSGHPFDKVVFVVGLLLLLAALAGWKMQASERAPTALGGVAILLLGLKSVIALSDAMGDIAWRVGAVTMLAVVILNLRRRRSRDAAA